MRNCPSAPNYPSSMGQTLHHCYRWTHWTPMLFREPRPIHLSLPQKLLSRRVDRCHRHTRFFFFPLLIQVLPVRRYSRPSQDSFNGDCGISQACHGRNGDCSWSWGATMPPSNRRWHAAASTQTPPLRRAERYGTESAGGRQKRKQRKQMRFPWQKPSARAA